jgi:hypothetical protein
MLATYRLLLVFAAFAADCSFAFGAPDASPTALSAEVRDALSTNATSLTTATIIYQETHSQPALTKAELSHGSMTHSNTTHTVIWQSGKIYVKDQRPTGGQSESSFDGEILYIGADHNSLAKDAISPLPADRPVFRLPYWHYAGLMLPETVEQVRSGQVRSTVLAAIDDGGQIVAVTNAEVSGRPVVIVNVIHENTMRQAALGQDLVEMRDGLLQFGMGVQRTQHYIDGINRARQAPDRIVESFALDVAYHYAVLRSLEKYPDGTLISECDNSDFIQLNPTIWLPRRCERKSRYHATFLDPDLTHDFADSDLLVASKLSAETPQAGQFALNYSSPGTVLVDRTNPNTPTTKEIVSESLADSHWSVLQWVGVIVLCVVLVLALAYGVRRLRQYKIS